MDMQHVLVHAACPRTHCMSQCMLRVHVHAAGCACPCTCPCPCCMFKHCLSIYTYINHLPYPIPEKLFLENKPTKPTTCRSPFGFSPIIRRATNQPIFSFYFPGQNTLTPLMLFDLFLIYSDWRRYSAVKGVSHEIFRVFFWHVWIDLGLCKNLSLFLIFSVEPLILYLHLKFKCG